jgi:hypothetical protein
VISALLMLRRLLSALRYALREEDFAGFSASRRFSSSSARSRSLSARLECRRQLYVAVATLTTSSVLDPKLTFTDPWLKLFTAGYVLVGIGILVEVARRLRMGFIAAREHVSEQKHAEKAARSSGPATRTDVSAPATFAQVRRPVSQRLHAPRLMATCATDGRGQAFATGSGEKWKRSALGVLVVAAAVAVSACASGTARSPTARSAAARRVVVRVMRFLLRVG